MIVCRFHPEINMQESIGVHEFTVVPRSVFPVMGQCYTVHTSVLKGLLENEAATSTTFDEPTIQLVTKKVDIVDSMTELQ